VRELTLHGQHNAVSNEHSDAAIHVLDTATNATEQFNVRFKVGLYAPVGFSCSFDALIAAMETVLCLVEVLGARQYANEFGLTKEDGNPNEQGIDDVAKIANWDTKGGAQRSPLVWRSDSGPYFTDIGR